MSFWERISRVFRSNVNDAITKAEDPQKILEQLILDMRTQLVDAKKQVAVAIADEKSLAKQVEARQAEAKDWKAKAMQAVNAGKDDLARQALARHKEIATIATELSGQWEKQQAAVDQLKSALKRLNDKIEEAKRKKGLLIARARRADAQKQIHETLNGLSESSAFDTFQRMEEKVDQKEAEADAHVELSEEMTGDSLAQEFEALNATGSDADLMALKAEMGEGAPEEASAEGVPALPPASAVDDLESELQAMKAQVRTEAPAGGGDPSSGS